MKKRIIFFFLLLVTVYFTSCEKDPIMKNYNCSDVHPTFSMGDTINLQLNEWKTLENSSFCISLDSVLNDSRCPIGWSCFWAGNGEVRFIVRKDGHHHVIVLNTFGMSPMPNDTLLDDIYIKLVRLDPYPNAFYPSDYSEYNADIVLSSRP